MYPNLVIKLLFLTSCLIISINCQAKRSCSIVLNSSKNYQQYSHQLVLLRGRISCTKNSSNYDIYPNNISPFFGRLITIKRNDGLQSTWPVNSENFFSALIRLKKGINTFDISYYFKPSERANYEISLIFEENNIPTVPLVIFHSLNSSLKFSIDEVSRKNGEQNDIFSAVNRLRVAALLCQSFISDYVFSTSKYNNLETFRLALNEKYDPIVYGLESDLSLNELKKKFDNPEDFYNLLVNTIKDSDFYNQNSDDIRNQMIYVIVVLEANWSQILAMYQYLNDQRGDIPKLVVLGSDLIHTFPESDLQLIDRFTDRTQLNQSISSIKNLKFKYNALNFSMAEMIKQFGNLLKMTNQNVDGNWFLNTFLSIEPNPFYIESENKDLEFNTIHRQYLWPSEDLTKMINNPNVKNSAGYGNYFVWKVNNQDIYLRNNFDTEWVEIRSNNIFFKYNYIYQDQGTLYFYSAERSLYYSINSTDFKSGLRINTVDKSIYQGTWITDLSTEIFP